MEQKRNIIIKICYDGTNYYGWNVQPNVPTIQGEILKSIERITGETTNIKGASRTDRGVHALGQVANFFTSSNIPAEKFKDALNSILPQDIRIIQSKEGSHNFDSRRSAKEKIYKYIIYRGEITPFMKNYVLCIKRELNTEKMKEIVKIFEGEKDFKNFTPERGFTIRTVTKAEITEKGNFIIFEIRGRGFLRYMVRNIVGTLILAGLEKLDKEEVEKLLDTQQEEKKYVKFTAPPHGLYLVDVVY
ncbi:MAG: tRNA pseudouridine(38-40) synthase TruA [Candidatus Calescibacterium sp.]|nr:tRNA pseudouridine(38-40) synthase TruA [Candidatus Calescibacterium sp.]MCX7734902.1 tRNA pseudouridine(38-40) synthase TruA [bacterium]MDW8086593.1 tRNA pseudouridine(38-40) synthase TruA [Candidatus Calescibacterium sp.]